MISITAKESNFEANKLTDIEDEARALAINLMVSATRSGQVFAKAHNQMAINLPEAVTTPTEAE